MQNKQPECGADLSTQYLNILFGVVGSPRFTWNEIRKLDHLSPNDGSSSDTLAKEAQTIGTCDLTLCPDVSNIPTNEYVNPAIITSDMVANASTRKIGNYAFIDNPTMQQIKDNIFDHKAVGLRVNCGDAWWKNGWSEAATCPLKLGTYSGDHFILATGFDNQYIKGPNSWSTDWGKQGMYYFDESYIPYVKELIIYIPPSTAAYQFLVDFGYGTTSADVHQLQIRLGLSKENQTGYFGNLTRPGTYKVPGRKSHYTDLGATLLAMVVDRGATH